MELVITMLEEQIRISENRLTTNHYPLEIEPTVRLKITQCKEAIDILHASQNDSTSDDALHMSDVVLSEERAEFCFCERPRIITFDPICKKCKKPLRVE